MQRVFTKIRNVLGWITLVAIALAVCGGLIGWLMQPGVPSKVIIELDLERPFVEYKPASPIADTVLKESASLFSTLAALERATHDDRVVGLVAHIGKANMGFATVQELREAIMAFRKSGKKAIAFSETFGEFQPGNLSYFLAAAFDEIHLQPSGDLGLVGLQAENFFLLGAFDKLRIPVRGDHRKEYKTAKNLFMESSYTEAHREATQAIMGSMFAQMVQGIAEGRKLEAPAVRTLIDQGPFLGAEAQNAGLVDHMSYWDEVRTRLEKEFGEEAELLYLEKYLDRAGHPYEEGEVVALVHGVGQVVRGHSTFDPIGGFRLAGGAVAAALRAATEDDEVKAILFRVNSPGGSYVASDLVWREVARARAAQKPVIVSMGDVAGSGGYFIAMNSDKIVANGGTITGSIGVLNIKLLTRAFWENLGITWDHLQTSRHATMYSGLHDFNEEEWSRFQDWLNRIYEDFTSKVAEGRDLEKEKVLEVAKGRVWTGVDAQKVGLVDRVGGFRVALDVVRETLGLEADAPIELRSFPRAPSPVQMLLSQGPDSSEDQTTVLIGSALRSIRPVVQAAEVLGLTRPAPATLQLDAFRVE